MIHPGGLLHGLRLDLRSAEGTVALSPGQVGLIVAVLAAADPNHLEVYVLTPSGRVGWIRAMALEHVLVWAPRDREWERGCR